MEVSNKKDTDNIVHNKENSLAAFFRYDFRYRKSIFATLFAVFLVMAVLFLMLYLRCYNFYINSENDKGLWLFTN